MNRGLDHPRYERKLLPGGCSLSEVLALVRRHPALFREVYPERIINNVYLDRADLSDYFDHINGVAQRSKLRIRWYGALHGCVAAPALEHKVKDGYVMGKTSEPLPAMELNGRLDQRFLEDLRRRATISERAKFELDARHPTLVNRYSRRYFLSGDGRFRLTIDTGLQFLSPETLREQWAAEPPPGFEIVIELKFVPEAAGSAEGITSAFPFRVTRCSKYVLGIECLHPR